ncbi:MAG: peptide deformylase, partial [Chloroflexi bacterium]|nr:peptide deformylase [Chloroflexota bacterium]
VSGIDARAVHHEIDHLNGILFVDRLQKIADLYRITRTAEGESLAKLDFQDPLRLALQRNGLS